MTAIASSHHTRDRISLRFEKEVSHLSIVRREKGRILVVDDDPSLTLLVSRILGRAGHEVLVTSGAEEALIAIRDSEPDILLADIVMPNISGLELARAVRQKHPDIQVILMTGEPTLSSATTAVEIGACRYLSKPFSRPQLIAAVERAESERAKAEERRTALPLLRMVEDEQRKTAELDAAFSSALDSLWMAYQPIFRTDNGAVHAYEALLRSSEPRLPGPPDVLRAAEDLQAVSDLGRIVRARAAKPFETLEGRTNLFVNLHPKDLLDDDLFSPLSPLTQIANRVVLELTERASLEEIPDLVDRIARLRALGFQIAIDDLGAGYAAVSSIAIIEPELVKLDMSLVRGVNANPTKARIIRHLVRMAHDASALVVAEGVETTEEKAVLVELGCDFLQGYLLGRPAKWQG